MVTLVIILFFILSEFGFRLWHRASYGRDYHVSIKFPWKDSHVVPHPFLSYSYKRNCEIDKNQRIPYPIHTNKFFSFKDPLKLNNEGHFGGDFCEPNGKVRVMCLGASTTANNISDGKSDYSYPSLLQESLGDKYEVFNCGIGGWTSVDILINFQLNLLKYKPDIIILYHGYNDLQYHLMHGFLSDYSHGRSNLGEFVHKIRLSYFLPKFKFWNSYEYVKDKMFGTGNVRNDVLRMINKKEIDYEINYETLEFEKSILENLFIICKHHKIEIICGSFVYYSYENTPVSRKLAEGVGIENKNMKDLSDKYGAKFVDQSKLIPRKKEMFVDSVHFTPNGMGHLSNNFFSAVMEVGEYE